MLRAKTVILTGAGRGIGAACARLMGGEGARLVLNDLDGESAEATAAAVRNAGGEAVALGGDMAGDGFPEQLAALAVSTYGAPDVVVSNAGFLFDGMLHKQTDAQWSAILDCHLSAPFRLARAVAPHMRAAAKAEIDARGFASDRALVNVSSTSGLHGNVGQANYAAAKAGVVGLTKTAAREWGPLGIRANCVAFGMIDTRMTRAFSDAVAVGGEQVAQGLPEHVAAMWQDSAALSQIVPLARKGTADEAAGAILFLASPLASYVTGTTLEVTGGMGM